MTVRGLLSRVFFIVRHEGARSLVIRPYKLFIKGFNRVLIRVFCLLPIEKKKLILESQGDYTDNPRVFSDYVSQNNPSGLKVIWLVQEPKRFRGRHEDLFVSRNELSISIEADYHIATAGYFIFSHPYWLTRWRAGQTVINTTHSVAQLKASSDKGQRRLYDYVLTCSQYCTSIRKKTFFDNCDDHYICIGQPRIDLMMSHRDCREELLPLHAGCKLVLCMQTFKQTNTWNDSATQDKYAINVVSSSEELKALDIFLKEKNLVMVVKVHHLQDTSVFEDVALDNIIYLNDDELASHDIQINQLLENADVLLTDYSSVFYDYLLVDRPIGFLLGDIDAYKRGFMMDDPLAEMPGEKMYSYNELISFLDDCASNIDLYGKERRAIRSKVFDYCDAENSSRLYRWIENNIHMDGAVDE